MHRRGIKGYGDSLMRRSRGPARLRAPLEGATFPSPSQQTWRRTEYQNAEGAENTECWRKPRVPARVPSWTRAGATRFAPSFGALVQSAEGCTGQNRHADHGRNPFSPQEL